MKRLRHGRHHKDLVYVQEGDEPSDNDRRLAVFFTEKDADMIVKWGNFFWRSLQSHGHWERGEVEEAKDYWREKLARLDAMIVSSVGSSHVAVRAATESRKVERQHLAVLLRTLGVDVPELPEEAK